METILGQVKDVPFFEKLTERQRRMLCHRMTLEWFGAREFIIKIGDYGDKFYIIIGGSVAVQVLSKNCLCPRRIHEQGLCSCPDRPLETAIFLSKGMSFGEMALQSNTPRTATIMATEKTATLVVTRADYADFAGTAHREFIEQRISFLRSCPNIGAALDQGVIQSPELAIMADMLNEQSLSGNQLAIRQGDPAEHIFFVRSGRLAVLRCLEPERSTTAGRANTLEPQTKAWSDLKKRSRETRLSLLPVGQSDQAVARASPKAHRLSSISRRSNSKQSSTASDKQVELPAMARPKPKQVALSSRSRSPSPSRGLSARAPLRQIVRIGNVGAHRYFGENFCPALQTYPVTLMSDPMAEIFTLSKSDILRRLPRMIFHTIFRRNEASLPADSQILLMLQQTERWKQYSRGLVDEAVQRRSQEIWARNHRVDAAAANLEFLGIDPSSSAGIKLLRQSPRRCTTSLSFNDQKHMSQVNSRFLQKVEVMSRDPRVKASMVLTGHCRDIKAEEDSDPLDFHFDQGWANLSPTEFDLEAKANETGESWQPGRDRRPFTTGGRSSAASSHPRELTSTSPLSMAASGGVADSMRLQRPWNT